MNGKLINLEAMQEFQVLPHIITYPNGVITNFQNPRYFQEFGEGLPAIALVGDSIFLHPEFEDFGVKCVPPLPVWDVACFEILENACSRFSKVFWSCGNEMVGCNFHNLIVRFPLVAPENRRIEYQTVNQRSFMGNGLYKRIPKASIPVLRQMFYEQVVFFLDKYPNLTLVPLLAYKFEYFGPAGMEKYCNIYGNLIDTGRCLDLGLLELDGDDWTDSIGHLSHSGAKKVKRGITEWE